MKLPGQSRSASRRLVDAIAEVQQGLGRNIVFLPLEQRRETPPMNNVGGYHESYNGEERVCLARLPYTALEAMAAHELAHIVQLKEGYPLVSSLRGPDGRPLIPALEHLAARTHNLVMDESADLWAINRGFDMGKALSHIGLDRLVGQLNHNKAEREAVDWDAYFCALKKLAREVNGGKSAEPFDIPAEVETQVMILDYAGLSPRLGRYGLFGALDATWQEHWPVSRQMGRELAGVVASNGVENAAKCRIALEKIMDYLKIPESLMSIG